MGEASDFFDLLLLFEHCAGAMVMSGESRAAVGSPGF